MVPTEDASIQKTRGKLNVMEPQQLYQSATLQNHSLVSHFLNKFQANLSLPDTPHSIQQKEFSLPSTVISIVHKMLLESGNNFSAARESTARVWRERDNRVARRSPVAVVVMNVVDLQRSESRLALYWQIRRVFGLRTMVPAVLIVLFERTTLRALVRTCVSAMSMLERSDGGKERNERSSREYPQILGAVLSGRNSEREERRFSALHGETSKRRVRA